MTIEMIDHFRAFDAENPRVFGLFVRFAHEARAAGHEYFSADAIVHRIRWETAIVTRDHNCDFKVNDHYVAFYARKLMAEDPSFRGFFRLRSSVADMMVAA